MSFGKIVCPSPKVWDFDEKRFHWASVAVILYSRNGSNTCLPELEGTLHLGERSVGVPLGVSL